MVRRILFPADFSEASQGPFRQAVRFAEEWEAHLVVLHVIHDPALEEEEDEEMRAFYADLQARAEERMERLVPEDRRGDITCLIHRGEPIREILRCAMTEEADIIVIGSHGMSGVASRPFGATARAVVLLAPVPVLVVKPEGYDPRRAAESWETPNPPTPSPGERKGPDREPSAGS